MHLHGQKLWGVLEKFSCTSSFLVKKAKNNIFEDKCFLSKMYYQIKMQAATNWSSHLKNIKHFNFFKRQIFLYNFQSKIAFSEIFENHQQHA